MKAFQQQLTEASAKRDEASDMTETVEADSLRPGDVVPDFYGRRRVVAVSGPCELNGPGGWHVEYEPIECRDEDRSDGQMWLPPDHRAAATRDGFRLPAELTRRGRRAGA